MKEILIDLKHCLGCKSCELACAVEHSASKNLFTAIFAAQPPVSRIYVEKGQQFNFPMQCRHCADAQCVKSCISGALWREEETGIVKFIPERCVGCWMCVMACPFGAIVQDRKEQIALKCDRCPEREIPACVAACPTKAITLQAVPAYAREKRQAYLANFQEQ